MPTSEAIAAGTTLGLTVGSQREIVEQIRRGFPLETLRTIEARLGVTHADLASLLGLPMRSFARRLKATRLSQAESDALYRIARIYSSATEALGSEAKAARWLTKPNRALGDVVPLRLLDTEAGAREVENVLGRVLHGVFS